MADSGEDAGRDGVTVRALDGADDGVRERAAALLHDGFAADWPDAWPTLADARAEVDACLDAEGAMAFGAFAGDGALLGWAGAQPQYRGHVWELHPLVVRADARRRGIARALVDAVADEGRRRGGSTLWVGTDDESAMTTLGGADLYPDPLAALAAMRDLRGHPSTVYRRLGFVLAGVLPDANGPGKPDVFLARPLRAEGA